MEELRKQMQQHMQRLRQSQQPQQNRRVQPRVFNGRATSVSSQSSMSDGRHTITLTQKNGDKRLFAKDSQTGKVLFDGPINTKDQRSKSLPRFCRNFSAWKKGRLLSCRSCPADVPRPPRVMPPKVMPPRAMRNCLNSTDHQDMQLQPADQFHSLGLASCASKER